MLDTSSTNIAEARYIKGDPLKGYYDFVITEGSYKFWAIFQVHEHTPFQLKTFNNAEKRQRSYIYLFLILIFIRFASNVDIV